MEYFVSPTGDDAHPGTLARPYRTIARGLRGDGASQGSTLKSGDILTLRGGTYVEPVVIRNLHGSPDEEITIRSFSGERAVIDASISVFRVPNNDAWVPARTLAATSHPDEWVSATPFPDLRGPVLGAFIGTRYRRLITYSNEEDFRSENQTFDKIFGFDPPNLTRGPWKVTDKDGVPVRDPDTHSEYTFPWVYMGPGLWYDAARHRIHIRLTHTTNNVSNLDDYTGPTDPNNLSLAVCDITRTTLTITDSRCLVFRDLTVRFGGRNTILIDKCESISFYQVEVWASTGGIRFGSLMHATFRDCRFDGGLPPWLFRGDLKSEYWYLRMPSDVPRNNTLAKTTTGVLMYGEGINRRDFEIDHCEFVNGHDLYLVASNMHFHHNWIDNLNDEGMMLDAQASASGRIHSNVITRCLSPISMAVGGWTAGQWYIYRNLIDVRGATAGFRPRYVGDTAVWRYGNVFKSNETTAPDGPYDLFHNTFLVDDQQGQAAYLHYRSDLSPHPHRSFNNLFVAVNPQPAADVAITFVPPPTVPGPTDGNLYHRIGHADAAPVRSLGYTFEGVKYLATTFATLDELRGSTLFKQSRTQYPPGYEANSLLADPRFRRISDDGSWHALDDLRLRQGSPARESGVKLPPELQELDNSLGSPPATNSRDIGCYPFGSPLLRVGVRGRRRFPIIGTVP